MYKILIFNSGLNSIPIRYEIRLVRDELVSSNSGGDDPFFLNGG